MAERHDELATKKDLDQLKQELIAKIDDNSAKIDRNGAKIDSNSAKIDRNSMKIDQVEKRLTARLDRLTDYAIENRELVGKMLTEEKFKVYFNELMSNIDGLAKIVMRGEQERTAMSSRLDRVEEDVDKNKSDIAEIKEKLAMP